MNKNVTKFIRTARKTVVQHAPEILTGIGVAGMITTTILAVKATPKALELVEEETEKKEDILTKKEVVKVTWKCYIPAVVTGVTSAACIIGGSSVRLKRYSVLATAYKISETAVTELTEYKEKTKKIIGETKAREIRDKINEERVEKTPVSKAEVIIAGGETLFLDYYSKRYFKSDLEKMRRIENYLNKKMLNEMYISLSEVYDEIGLEHTLNSDEMGWSMDRDGFIDFGLEHPSAVVADDGTPCIVIDYSIPPRYEFNKFY